MAKKRDPWDLSAQAIEKKAKASIKEVTTKNCKNYQGCKSCKKGTNQKSWTT